MQWNWVKAWNQNLYQFLTKFPIRILALHKTNLLWRFRKILWLSQNIWTLMFRTPVNHIIPTLYFFFYGINFFKTKKKEFCPWRAEISFNSHFHTLLWSIGLKITFKINDLGNWIVNRVIMPSSFLTTTH